MKNMKYCVACNRQLPCQKLYEYVQCPECRSYSYVSDQPADAENKQYFDTIFQTLGDRQNHERKRILFEKYVHIDNKLRKKQYVDFIEKRDQIRKHLQAPSKILEIGFGSGEHLYGMLRQGMDVSGVDLSETAIRNFIEKYPEYANRVQCGTRFNKQVDVVYCCALLEHLDMPAQFIQDASECLCQNGLLIIDALPLLNERLSSLTADEDISFWKPCHRMIYSLSGLNLMMGKYGFTNEIYALHDDYYYRVLSLHVKYGYRNIIELRSSTIRHDALPGYFAYCYLCWRALCAHSLALHGCFMFRKVS